MPGGFWHFARPWEGPLRVLTLNKREGRTSCVKFVTVGQRLSAFTVAGRGAAGARIGNMARRCGRATSRFDELHKISIRMTATAAFFFGLCLAFPPAAEAGLYTASDQIVLLSEQNVGSVLINSSAAMVVEFYASWCGHCIAFSPTYKKLAGDIKGWYGSAACVKHYYCDFHT